MRLQNALTVTKLTCELLFTYPLTYGKDFTHLIRDLHFYCMYPDSLPNSASNFCLRLFRRAVYHCCRRRVPDPQENLFPVHLKGISCDLNSCPDLFPSLAVLCSLSQGESLLYGAPHLKYKESDRIQVTAQLIQKINRAVQIKDDGLFIKESKGIEWSEEKIFFDPQSDHRIAMAAALLIYAGINVQIKNPGCVKKSFPEFWNIIDTSSSILQ